MTNDIGRGKLSDKTFPYTGWVLQPSFKPAQVELVEEYNSFGDEWHKNANGKYFSPKEIYSTKAEAIAAGRQRLGEMQAKIDKTLAGMAKKAEALRKAETP